MFRAPIVTLAAVVVLGLVLIGVDMAVQRPAADTAATPAAVAPAPAPATPPTVVAAASPTAFPTRVRYVGDVVSEGVSIPIAITVDGGRAKAYVCDGRHVEAWLQGEASPGTPASLDATGRHGNHLTGQLDGDRLTGTVHLAGRPDAPFTASPATDPAAGVYRRAGADRTTGWIVGGNGGQVGLSHDGTGAVGPAPPLPVAGPLPAGVAPVDGTTDVLASP